MTNTTKHKRPMRNIPVNISYQIRIPGKTPMTDLEVLIYSPLYNTTIYLDREDKVRDKFDEYIRSKNKLENPENFVIVGMGTNANDTIPLKNTTETHNELLQFPKTREIA